MIEWFDNKKSYVECVTNFSISVNDMLENDANEQLEKVLCNYTKAKYCQTTKSGTQALTIALKALNVEGKYVITTPYTFVATVSAIAEANAKVLFADIDANTYNINPKNISTLISKYKDEIGAILTVDLFGNPCDYGAIVKIAKQYNIPIVEDACQALSAKYHDTMVGNIEGVDITCTSFYPTKPCGGFGEGGAIFTNNDELYKFCKQYANHGYKNGESVIYGTNGRADAINSLLLIEKFKNIDNHIKQRRKIDALYKQYLSKCKFQMSSEFATSAYYIERIFAIGKTKDVLLKYFKTNDTYDVDLTQNKLFAQYQSQAKIAKLISQNTISLPIYSEMNLNELEETLQKVQEELHF